MNDSKTHATLKFSDSDQTVDFPIYVFLLDRKSTRLNSSH